MSSEMDDQVPIIPPDFLEFMDDISRNITTTDSINMVTTNQQTTQLRRPKVAWRRGRKMTGNVPYTTDLGRRRRSEVCGLRLEVEQLSARLAQLTEPCQARAMARPLQEFQALEDDQYQWRIVAMAEKDKRLHAEETRRRLKVMLLRQSNVINSIRKFLKHSDLFEGRDFVERLHPTADQNFLRLDSNKLLLEEMSGSLSGLRLQVNDVLPVVDETLAVSLRTRTRQHETHGICFEKNEVTRMTCTTQQAADIYWSYLTNFEKVEQICRHVQSAHPCENNYEQNLIGSQTIHSKNGGLLPIYVLTSFRKIEEGNRVILVGTLVWFLQTEGGLQFEDKYWSVVSPLPTDPTQSVIQTFSRLQVRNGGTKPIFRKQNEVMDYFSQISRQYMQQRQDDLIELAYAMVA